MNIRPASHSDSARICEIYNHYVRDTVVTFEESPVTDAEMSARIAAVTANLPWLALEAEGRVLGYAYATAWKTRAAYRHSAETSIYLDHAAIGRGLGSRLYAALIAELKNRGVHCVIGGAAMPNPASVSLHEKLGFKKVAEFPEVGFKFGRWVSVAYWELLL